MEISSPIRARLATESREMVAEARSDQSLLVLIVANLLALGVAHATGMGLRELMFIYWIQSVVIGAMHVVRILSLERFDPSNFRINDQPAQETAADKRKVAVFFAGHYGLFHVVYLVFLLDPRNDLIGSVTGTLICALVFVANHGYSLRHNVRRDAAGRPNLGKLTMMPYARIVPMHLTILMGAHVSGGTGAFFLFGALKTLADVVMHTVEHHVLQRKAADAEGLKVSVG